MRVILEAEAEAEAKSLKGMLQRILTYFERGSISVRQTSCLSGLDLTKTSKGVAAKQLYPNKLNRRSVI